MKSLIITSLILGTASAFADSAKFSIPSFKGEIISNKDLVVETVTVTARIQHCNIWGTTCAGGPAEVKQEVLKFKNDTSANLISFELKKGFKLSSSKVGNRFSSCNLSVNVVAKNDIGAKYQGNVELVFENNKSVCESSEEIKNMVTDKLKVPVKVNFWRKY